MGLILVERKMMEHLGATGQLMINTWIQSVLGRGGCLTHITQKAIEANLLLALQKKNTQSYSLDSSWVKHMVRTICRNIFVFIFLNILCTRSTWICSHTFFFSQTDVIQNWSLVWYALSAVHPHNDIIYLCKTPLFSSILVAMFGFTGALENSAIFFFVISWSSVNICFPPPPAYTALWIVCLISGVQLTISEDRRLEECKHWDWFHFLLVLSGIVHYQKPLWGMAAISVRECVCVRVCVQVCQYVCECVRERKRERDNGGEKKRKRDHPKWCLHPHLQCICLPHCSAAVRRLLILLTVTRWRLRHSPRSLSCWERALA